MTRYLALVVGITLFFAPAFADKAVKGDGEIHDQVLIKLAGDQDVKGTGIEVEVKDGVVILTGKVESEKIRNKAERLAKKVKGVKSVDDRLAVGPR